MRTHTNSNFPEMGITQYQFPSEGSNKMKATVLPCIERSASRNTLPACHNDGEHAPTAASQRRFTPHDTNVNGHGRGKKLLQMQRHLEAKELVKSAYEKQDNSEWNYCMSSGFRPGYNGMRTKYFPRSSQAPQTTWNLNPKPIKDDPEVCNALLECEAHKAGVFSGPWSSDAKGKPFKAAEVPASAPIRQQPLSWKQLQAILHRENAILIEYDVLDREGGRDGPAHNVVSWVVDQTGSVMAHTKVEVVEVMGSGHEMSLERLTARMDDTLRIFGRAILRKFYNMCILPIEDVLRGQREVILVPAGPLCFVPWAALMNRNGHYFTEGHTIRVLPHLLLLHGMHRSERLEAAFRHKLGARPETTRALVVGNPMPISSRFGSGIPEDGELVFAQPEVDEAVSILRARGGAEVQVLVTSDATKSRTIEGMRGASFVHIAAHVEEQMLLLAADHTEGDTNDGVLGCDELVGRIKLAPGSTVVLSACNVAQSGAAMFELSRAFIAVGAAAVLISMWSLMDESTCALMRRVYRHLGAQKPLADALRCAMLQLAGRQFGEEIDAWDNPSTPFSMLPYSRPLHWAGLIVVGSSTYLPGMGPRMPGVLAFRPSSSSSPCTASPSPGRDCSSPLALTAPSSKLQDTPASALHGRGTWPGKDRSKESKVLLAEIKAGHDVQGSVPQPEP